MLVIKYYILFKSFFIYKILLKLSEILITHSEIDNFEDLVLAVKKVSQQSDERFFKIDVKPPFNDVPENWEDRLEASFC